MSLSRNGLVSTRKGILYIINGSYTIQSNLECFYTWCELKRYHFFTVHSHTLDPHTLDELCINILHHNISSFYVVQESETFNANRRDKCKCECSTMSIIIWVDCVVILRKDEDPPFIVDTNVIFLSRFRVENDGIVSVLTILGFSIDGYMRILVTDQSSRFESVEIQKTFLTVNILSSVVVFRSADTLCKTSCGRLTCGTSLTKSTKTR
mmetsp:Transcript_20729/g.31650  ORF Transcript_20729/g.31650 Transcript_20729/m.31650 type:complete len:209 (-) Transcript_20729:144-770(-)